MPKLSTEGKIFLCITLLALGAAIATSLNLVYLVFSVLAALFPVSYAVNAVMLKNLEVSRSVPGRVLSGELFFARVTVRNRRRFFPALAVRVVNLVPVGRRTAAFSGYAFAVPARSEKVIRCGMTLTRRGKCRIGRLTLSTTFPFGLFACAVEVARDDEVVVYPSVGFLADREFKRLSSHAWGRKLLGRRGSDEFRTIREYRDGDNYRLIHWKVSARQSKLMVRELEAERTTSALILLDTCVSGLPERIREASLENAVSFVATIAYRLFSMGYSIEYAAYSPNLTAVTGSNPARSLRVVFEDLALLEPSPDKTIEALIPAVSGPELKNKVVIAVSYSDGIGNLPRGAVCFDVTGRDFKRTFRRSGAAAVMAHV